MIINCLWCISVYGQQNIYVKLNKQQVERLTLKNENGRRSVQFGNQKIDRAFSNLNMDYFEVAYPHAQFFDHPLKDEVLSVYKFKGKFKSDSVYNILKGLGIFEEISISSDPVPTFLPNDFGGPTGIRQQDLVLINAQQAWDITKGSASIKVAVIDNGFDVTHEDLANQIVYTHGDVSYNPLPGQPDNSHGNSTAGCVAAETNNGIGISSIGYNTKLMLYKFVGQNHYDQMLHASLNGAKVISCSFIDGCNAPNSVRQSIINMVVDNGTTVIASAGNGNLGARCFGDWDNDGVSDVHGYAYPASYDNVISVSGVDNGNTYFTGAVGGPGHFTFNDKVDLTAPGFGVDALSDNDAYDIVSGTSFATPMVGGTIALMLDVNSCISPREVDYILKQSADASVNNPGIYPENTSFIDRAGAGRLDAYEAVKFARDYPQSILGVASVSGPNAACFSSTSFTLQNTPDANAATIVWSKSGNLTYISGQGTHNYTVRANASTTSSSGWVEATIITGCGTVVIRKDIWVGKPQSIVPNEIGIGPTPVYQGNWATYIHTTAQVPAGAYNFNEYFAFGQGNHFTISPNLGIKGTIYVKPGTPNGSYQFVVDASNNCGGQSFFGSVNVGTSGGGGGGGCPMCPMAMLSPVPTSEALTVEFLSKESNEKLDPEDFEKPRKYRVLDINGKEVYSLESSKKVNELNLSSIERAGYYILLIDHGHLGVERRKFYIDR